MYFKSELITLLLKNKIEVEGIFSRIENTEEFGECIVLKKPNEELYIFKNSVIGIKVAIEQTSHNVLNMPFRNENSPIVDTKHQAFDNDFSMAAPKPHAFKPQINEDNDEI